MNILMSKPEIDHIARKYNLLLVILYGSHASGRTCKESDIDIAVLGTRPITFENLIDLNNEFAEIFKVKEIDVKSLHNTNSLFRYQVMSKGVLLYGKSYDYNSFKSYAFRDYYDSQDLLRLKEVLIKKRLQNLGV
ncbi:nucleotidyltransferase domain protein [Candidatus Kuenenia stuttgartiensis]|nr:MULTISPECIES: nucleotidyltransferase domain-containing protein [Kuenenia]MBE7548141.1 nucleotidyltransferase domain-containing protein [Planctomycetia bacterium]MBW7941328.1 nucleotidyltransferase domain-containing protein [Candidatus Kuenenia stuttgartiensis]MBZ0190067.1 nucleotidyltransferase domain-containing protein [Candidatus Kuenenia stuttgartiensis]MCF6153634.1 nucleotidyltransferase domain-containing protein [Candidatus Kuenenia stuttgartiensis]MCL4727923.1 nucleotidyltransferase d